MSDGDDDGLCDRKPSSAEEFMEAIQEMRDEQREQVSFEWVETVRQAGELWREVEDAETVTEQIGKPRNRVNEALTVYRLIFEEPPDVSVKATEPSQQYFSLGEELEDDIQEDAEAEPVEDLLREYVGALYLEHDLGNVPVGEPPEEEKPPMAYDLSELEFDMNELLPRFHYPTSTIAAMTTVSNMQEEVLQQQVSTLSRIMEENLLWKQNLVANAVQPIVSHQVRIASQNLVRLMSTLEEHQNVLAKSMALTVANTIPDISFPDSVFADLAAIQSTTSAAAAATTSNDLLPTFEEQVVNEASKTTAEAKRLEATKETVPTTGPVGASLGAEPPEPGNFTMDLVVEIPSMIVESMLSTGQARVWFSELPEEHQLTTVRLLLASVAVYITGNPFAAPIAIIIAPSVRRGIVIEEWHSVE